MVTSPFDHGSSVASSALNLARFVGDPEQAVVAMPVAGADQYWSNGTSSSILPSPLVC